VIYWCNSCPLQWLNLALGMDSSASTNPQWIWKMTCNWKIPGQCSGAVFHQERGKGELSTCNDINYLMGRSQYLISPLALDKKGFSHSLLTMNHPCMTPIRGMMIAWAHIHELLRCIMETDLNINAACWRDTIMCIGLQGVQVCTSRVCHSRLDDGKHKGVFFIIQGPKLPNST